MKLKNLLQRRNHEKFKEHESDSLPDVKKFQGKLFGSIALMLNVYANDVNRQNDDKILILDSVNKAFETLKIIFTRRVDKLPKDVDCQQQQQQQLDIESSKKESTLINDESKYWYTSCISRYLHDYQRRNQDTSLCKIMTKMTTSKPRIFVAYRKRETPVEYSQRDLVDIANVLMKLTKYLTQQCQRQRLIVGKATKSISHDKAVQCDYLQVSPEVKFFSRSSVVIDAKQQQRQRNSSPSLEYFANYRPEFGGRKETLRSLSSSASFVLPTEKHQYSRSQRKTRLKRGPPSSLETLKQRRNENDMILYSNFIEADFTSFHYNDKFRSTESIATHLEKNDVFTAKKILLDDYITEVKEIIRSELSSRSSETQILDSVRKRINEEVILSERTDSYRSLSPSVSYVTAHECSSSNYCLCKTACDCRNSETCFKLPEVTSRSKGNIVGSREQLKSSMTYFGNKKRYSKSADDDKIHASSTSAKSSQSIDSGVQLDFVRSSSTDYTLSDNDASLNEFKTNKTTITPCCSESSSSSDEMLCRRVESAVRKFTEKLIVCERRAKDRSRSLTVKRHENPRGGTSLTDQRICCRKSFNCSREMVNCSSSEEDECITGISTPSLVSLSDDEIQA